MLTWPLNVRLRHDGTWKGLQEKCGNANKKIKLQSQCGSGVDCSFWSQNTSAENTEIVKKIWVYGHFHLISLPAVSMRRAAHMTTENCSVVFSMSYYMRMNFIIQVVKFFQLFSLRGKSYFCQIRWLNVTVWGWQDGARWTSSWCRCNSFLCRLFDASQLFSWAPIRSQCSLMF